MLMVVFGAGASYDAISDFAPFPDQAPLSNPEYRPPLANQLFERRPFFNASIEQYHECGPIVPRLRHRPDGSNFERQLEGLRAEAADDPYRHVQLHAIRFYLRRILWNCGQELLRNYQRVTNYADLLDSIRYWRAKHPSEEVRFVTFNYDTLLEEASRSALGLEFRDVQAYVHGPYKIYKPHGSVNWIRTVENSQEVEAGNPEHSIIALGGRLKLLDGAYRIRHPDEAARQENGLYAYPAIALPVETKLDFECPVEHLNHLKVDIAEVTKLLVIGWRATEANFLDLWMKHRVATIPRIAVVAGGSGEAQRIQHNLQAAGIVGTFSLSDQGFTDFVTKSKSKLADFLAD